MRRGVKVALGAVAAVVVVGTVAALSFPSIVRHRIAAAAEARGMRVQVGEVRPAVGRLWLRNVAVTIPEVPAVTAVFDHVEVTVGLGLEVREITVHGGAVRVGGSVGEVRDQIVAWRGKAQSGEGAGSSRQYRARGVEVVWSGAATGAAEQHAWGVRYDRLEDGGDRVAADLVRLGLQGISLELADPFVELGRREGVRVVRRIGAETATGSLNLGSLPRLAKKGTEARASPSPTTAKPPGRLLRSRLAGVGAAIGEWLPPQAELALSSLRLELHSGDQVLNIGPAQLDLARNADRLKLDLVPGSAQQLTPLQMRLDLPLQRGDVTIEVDGGPISFAQLGVAEGSFGLLDVDETELSATARLRLRDAGDRLSFEGRGKVERLNLESPRIAASPMRGIDLGWRGQVELSGDLQRVELSDTELRIGKTRVELSGSVQWEDGELTRGDLRGGVPLASCQSMIQSAPPSLLPQLQALTMEGTFSLQASATFDFAVSPPPRVTWQMENDCRISGVPDELDPRRFTSSWVREVVGADGRPVTVETGPGTPSWVPIESISPHMPTAIVICEDARFYRHRGFDQAAIASAIADNLRARKFVRGASTVSMQLAKNLYLPRDKTASRKLQEAVLTILLEQSLTKDQLMELYLNVIEFGPGIYGIGPAAAYYFNSTAGQLSLGQSLYLASILPNPRSHHFSASGAVTDKWVAYLHKLMRIAHKIHRISDPELDEGLQEIIAFQQPYQPPAPIPDGLDVPDAALLGPPEPAPTSP